MAYSHDTVAHTWAHQEKKSMHGCNLFFEGDTIYSYGRHFPIAKLIPENKRKKIKGPVVLFNSESRSVSTSKHQTIVSRAIPYDYTILDVPDFNEYEPFSKHEIARVYKLYKTQIEYNYNKAFKARTYTQSYLATIDSLIEKGNQYLQYAGSKKRLKPLTEKDKEQLQKRVKEQDKKARERNKKLLQEYYQKIEEWKSFKCDDIPWLPYSVQTNIARSKTYLRFNKKSNRIETSKGVQIPVAVALKFREAVKPYIDKKESYDYSNSIWDEGTDDKLKVLHFKVNSIGSDGTIVIGCHKLQWDQFEEMFEQIQS